MSATYDPEARESLPNYAELVQLLRIGKPERFVELARTFNPDDEPEESPKSQNNRQQYAGKLLCAARTTWETLRQQGRSRRQEFPDYFESLTGCRPSGHAQSCAKTYRTLVLTGRIAESDYDENSSNAIQSTSRIISKVRDDMNHPAVAAAASILRQRGRFVIKELLSILDRLIEDPKTGQVRLLEQAEADDISTRPIGYSPARELAIKIAKEGHHSVLAAPLEELAASTSNLEEARSLAISATKILECLSNNRDERGHRRFSGEVLATWTAPKPPVSVVTAESLKAEYAAQQKKLQQIQDKLTKAGIVTEQPVFSTQATRPVAGTIAAGSGFASKRWRGAEQRVLELLRLWGWQVEDVSLQKLGYDIEGRTPDGEYVFVEVKSIENSRQAFTMTSNEEAVAREKAAAYRLALVRLTSTHLEIAFVSDPVRQLKFTRQYRQLVWECAAYEFIPERYPLE